MSNEPQAINVISDDEQLTQYSTLVEKNILWPLWAYNITLPVVGDSELNPLENVVYELIANKQQDPTEIAQLSGLNIDLVEFVISRLKQLEFIDERLNVTVTALNTLRKNDNVEYVAATIYYDILNKMYLPIIVKNGKPLVYARRNKNKYIFETGISGEAKEITAYCLSIKSAKAPKVTADNVFEIIRKYIKSQRTTNGSMRFLHGDISVLNVDLDDEPQLVYLHRTAFVPKGGDHVFVSTGVDGVINPAASRYLEKEVRWLNTQIKENADSKKLPSNGDVFKAHGSQFEYQLQKMSNAYDYLINNEVTSSNIEQESLAKQGAFFNHMYGALEHLFSAYTLLHPAEDVSTYFFSKNPSINGSAVLTMIKNLGFNTDKLVNYFYSINSNIFKYINFDNPSMSEIIALIVLSATQNKKHDLHQLAVQQPVFFEKIESLKKLRNASSHGDVRAEIKDKNEIENWYQWLKEVKNILGENKLTFIDPGKDVTHKNMALKISIAMDKHLNWQQKNTLPSDVLSVISNALRSQVAGDLNGMVLHAASALQKSYYYAAKEADIPSIHADISREIIIRDIEKKLGRVLPEKIKKTNIKRIKWAIEGADSTLGANTISFIYKANKNDLKGCGNYLAFVEVPAKLVELRGHNRILTDADISFDQARNLQCETFKVINVLNEYFF